MPNYGQLIIGPPGSGKTTYIKAIKNYYKNFHINTISINLDPSIDLIDIDAYDVNITDLICTDDVFKTYLLGPNASISYVFQFLHENIDWLYDKMKLNETKDIKYYYIIDTPGQTELYCQTESFKKIINKLTDIHAYGVRLCVVNITEILNIMDLPKYIFSSFNVLNSMINLELPQINVLSKYDLYEQNKNEINFIHKNNYTKEVSENNNNNNVSDNKDIEDNQLEDNLDLYLNPESELIKIQLDSYLNNNPKYFKLNELLCEFICDYSLVGYTTLDVNNARMLHELIILVDKANGYSFEFK